MSRLHGLRARLEARRRGRPAPVGAGPATAAPTAGPDPRDLELLDEIASRHPLLHARLASLDGHQLRAVLADDPAVLVQAQVGSGKTTVLVHRVLDLHLRQGIPLERLAVLTFTHKAAEEVRERLREVGADPEALWLGGTFHAVAAALLRRVLPIADTERTAAFQLIDPEQRRAVWEQLIEAHGLQVRYRAKLARRVEAWQSGRPRWGNMRRPDDVGKLIELYEAAKRDRDLLDFDDLVAQATALLSDAEGDWRPDAILIDEFQDCSAGQLTFAERLAGPATRWFAVGDANQSIYSWRGGDPRLFERFARLQSAVRIALPRNYRSTDPILAGARAVLGQAGGGELVGARGAGEPIAVVQHHDAHAEAIYLAERLARIRNGGVAWHELAVLTRTRAQLTQLAQVFEARDVPFQVGLTRDDGPGVTWLRQLLTFSLEPASDPAAWRSVLSAPRFGPLERRDLPREAPVEPGVDGARAALAEALDGAPTGARSARRRARLRAALTLCARLSELPAWLACHRDEPALDAALFAHLDLARALGPTRSTFAEDCARVRRALSRWLEAALGEGDQGDDGDASPRDGSGPDPVAALGAALGADRAPRRRPRAGRVALLTLHASKGLEFRHVFLAGANAGLIPLASAWRDAAQLAEERRLLFVGLTRARDTVEISYLTQPSRPDVLPEPSSFLADVPPDAIRWLTPDQVAERTRDPKPAAAASSKWTVGQRVRHRRYGEGEVVAANQTQVTVAFGPRGQKSFSPIACPLQPIPS